MTTKKHKMVMITNHSDEPGYRFGKWTAACICGRWNGMGADGKKLNTAFKEHLEFVKKNS